MPHMGGMDGMGEGGTVVEMSIPGSKVGLIIGKGGETIRQLQVWLFFLDVVYFLYTVNLATGLPSGKPTWLRGSSKIKHTSVHTWSTFSMKTCYKTLLCTSTL